MTQGFKANPGLELANAFSVISLELANAFSVTAAFNRTWVLVRATN